MGKVDFKTDLSYEERKLCNSNHVPIPQDDSIHKKCGNGVIPTEICSCNSLVNSAKLIPPNIRNIPPTGKRTNPIDFFCISCHRLRRQKEKELWLTTVPEPKPEKETPNQPELEPSDQATAVETKDSGEPVSVTSDTVWVAANKMLLSRLECPVCFQLMTPPLRQCRNGHSICFSCHDRLNRCPTCRRSFIETSNVLLNEICLIVVVPCRNYSAGCRQLVRLSEKAEHEKKCEWMQHDCPEKSRNCSWKGTQPNLIQHVMEEHSDAVFRVQLGLHSMLRYTYGPIQPVEDTGSEAVNYDVISRVLIIVDADGQEKGVCVFSVKHDVTNGSLCGILRYVGSSQEASNYSYKIRLSSPDNSFTVSATTLCVPYFDNLDDIIASGAIMRLDGCTFKKFVNEKGKFIISVKVTLRKVDEEQQDL